MLRKILFNFWYFWRPPWDTGISPPELLDFIHNHAPGKALDLGCGTGTNVITLAKYGWIPTGVDFSQRAISLARKKAENNNVLIEFLIDDVSQLKKLTEQYDLILDIGCYHNVQNKNLSRYAENISRLLAEHGYYLMYGFIKNREAGGPGLTDEHLEILGNNLKLIARKDSLERGTRPAAWFTYKLQT